jgi:hypothetical protein
LEELRNFAKGPKIKDNRLEIQTGVCYQESVLSPVRRESAFLTRAIRSLPLVRTKSTALRGLCALEGTKAMQELAMFVGYVPA